MAVFLLPTATSGHLHQEGNSVAYEQKSLEA